MSVARSDDDDEVAVAPLGAADYEAVLPLIADYQRFYGVEHPDEARNRSFFAPFVRPGGPGHLLGARRRGALVGYACVSFLPSSIEAEEVAVLNDLYVLPAQRGGGVGRALIDATITLARARPVGRVRWSTAIDNRRAQRLYEGLGAERSTWFEYEVSVRGTGPG